MYGIHTMNHILLWILFTCSLFQILKFISFLLVVAFCLYWGETHSHKCKVTSGHKTPQSQPPCPGKLLTDRGFVLLTSRSPFSPALPLRVPILAGLPPCHAFCASEMKCFQPRVPRLQPTPGLGTPGSLPRGALRTHPPPAEGFRSSVAGSYVT